MLDVGATSATDIFLQHGPWGAAVVALALACWRLFKQNQDLNEKRIADHKEVAAEYRSALEDNTRALDALARAYESRRG